MISAFPNSPIPGEIPKYSGFSLIYAHLSAMRRDIDRKIHLHYWECAQGVHELASVSFHDDFSIPE